MPVWGIVKTTAPKCRGQLNALLLPPNTPPNSHEMSPVTRKPVIWVCDKVKHKHENIGSTGVSNVVCQASRSSASWFRRRFLKFFTIYGHGNVT